MEPIKIKLLTPIWTGGINGRPFDIKNPSIRGSMRKCFEMLIRKHGGHTCNPVSDNEKCTYKIDKHGELETKICPVCAVFGCTGYSMPFKTTIIGDLKQIPVILPIKDDEEHNRPAHQKDDFIERKGDHYQYIAAVQINSWIGETIGFQRGTDISEKKDVRVTYSSKPVILNFNLLHKPLYNDLDYTALIKYLLFFQSKHAGLGAKNNQGWGIFTLLSDINPNHAVISEDIMRINQNGKHAIESLINKCQYNCNFDGDLPNGKYCFESTYTLPAFTFYRNPIKDSFKFTWAQQPGNADFYATGYALRYRLRRAIKFIGAKTDLLPFRRPGDRSKETLWDNMLGLVRILFGEDNAGEDNKQAGSIGVSHVYNIDGDWEVKLFGYINPLIFNVIPNNIKTEYGLQVKSTETDIDKAKKNQIQTFIETVFENDLNIPLIDE